MEELLTCSVCCERYCEAERQPVVLPRCGHSFCRPCVTLLLSANCIICPTCRTDQRIESAHRLPTEFTLLAIIAAQENAKLDNCTRHDVKLSFWCKTCNLATCGECLFEDHPTHSHDVIRSLTYIKNIKESVHEIGCKFMEALDTREQTYYKSVYTCARKIDEALRNVTVLRKDMTEARNLMKGVKVDEANMTLSTATSLAEAAKYLGLKWNIQDENFNRAQQEEKEKQTPKEPEKTEEPDESNRVLTAEEEKERRKERIRERKRKRLLKEAEKKEAEKLKAEEDKTATKEETKAEANAEAPQISSKTDLDAQKDTKKKISSLRKSKTMSVFEPLSMDKEIIGIKKNLQLLDNKERERIEIEAMKKIEEEEQVENDKKYLEEKALEATKEAEAAVEAVKAAVAIKEAELKKILDQEVEESTREAEEKAAFRKAAATEEMERLNKILQKPRGSLAMQFMEENAEATDLIENSEGKPNEEEKSNGTPEHTDKDNADAVTEPGLEQSSEVDLYAGELTPEEKEAREKAELEKKESETNKIFDFMKEPLFSICIEGAEGRLAMAQWEEKGIHVYCHQFQQLDYDIVIKSNVLAAMIPSKNPIVFIELTVGTDRPFRVYIKLWGHLRRAHNFMGLCLGDQGCSFLNTKLLQVYNLNEGGERILGGDHEYNSGRGGCALLRDLEWNGDYSMPMQEGLLTAAGSGQHATNSLFLICTRGDPSRNFSCPFGEVVEGLGEIRDAIAKSAAEQEEIWITECGIVLEPPRV